MSLTLQNVQIEAGKNMYHGGDNDVKWLKICLKDSVNICSKVMRVAICHNYLHAKALTIN